MVIVQQILGLCEHVGILILAGLLRFRVVLRVRRSLLLFWLQLGSRGVCGCQVARLGVGKGFFDAFKVLCDGFECFGGLLLLLSRFLGCLGNGISILRMILSIEQLLVGPCHRLLNLIDHIQSAVGVLGCLQLSGIENVLLGRHFQKSFLQFLDALIDLFLLFGILLRRRLWVFGFLLKVFGLLRGDLSEFGNRR